MSNHPHGGGFLSREGNKELLHQRYSWAETLAHMMKRFIRAFPEKAAISTLPEAKPPPAANQTILEGHCSQNRQNLKLKELCSILRDAAFLPFFAPGNPLRKGTFAQPAETQFWHQMKNLAENDLTASERQQHETSEADLPSWQRL